MTAVERHLLSDNTAVGADGMLTVGGCSVADVAAEYGTPVFVYDEAHLRSRCREAVGAFGPERVIYATKAFLCRAMARLAYDEGLLLDVASGGELHVAMSAGVPASACTLHGNNKSVAELRQAITAGVRHIIVDSFDELDRLDMLAAEGCGPTPQVVLRITPGVSAHTHEFIATGQDDSKFGFNLGNGDAVKAVDRARRSTSVDLVGVHCHIGSNVFEASSFAKAAEVMANFAVPLDLPELVLGGGLGVAYVAGEEAPTITQWGNVLLDACDALGVRSRVSVEPGRSIAAAAAMTIYTVGTIKTIPGVRTYVSVDGGMSDNPRPVLYGSGYESFLPRAVDAPRDLTARLVGKHCESGDVLSFEARLPTDIAVGDLLAMPVTGAYGQSMGSNYNKITRPPVVFCADGDAKLVVRRETFDDLLATDIYP
ncbi:diaminopimelate decarboxylase [Ilumatobacter coccineus]|uniref:Diaminopimelate decarboxylase n=1 Tax=Ilumatobacter coccineus (strain NBRC 103263 / KCTC 29153 / YM16-304) TaxID=1313172 RepID=A0A6C7E865_ILUCY|nr:diaminopimelate decarboxylase [Ilumatobacter coccineus]BAN01345.1 diaminopimelate decarboxylase [Ilumatobacter coccineus YM16-304]